MTKQEWDTAWADALDELELTLEETERVLAGEAPAADPAPWSPPQLATPLPPEMLARARDLLARQQSLIARTATAVHGTRTSLDYVGRVAHDAGVRRPAASVYLDVRA